jgi:hypothetical protein
VNHEQILIVALVTGPLGLFAFSGCEVSAEGSDLALREDVSETQQGLQICTSTCSDWGGQAVSCTSPTGMCTADSNGVTCDGGTPQQQEISCSCANFSVTLTTNSVGHASDETVTWTAHPSGGSGNYTYTWVQTWCRNGNAPGDCNGSSNTSTTTTPTRSVYSSTYMNWDKYCVTIHDNTCSAYGNSGSVCATVYGDGTCQPRPGRPCQQ